MHTSITISRHGVFARMAERPAGALLVGLLTAAICGGFGAIYGEVVAVIMAAVGAIVGAPFGAQMASSFHDDP
jgi:uncharacterized membrane protein AbrB (regulator of aidB expression)